MKSWQTKSLTILVVMAGLVVIPFFASGYITRFLTAVFMYLILTQAWNLFGGYTGYISFGHVAFFGVGAYSTAICMTKLNLPFHIGLAASALVPTIVALGLSFILFKLRGHYFVMGSLAIAEVFREIVSNMTSVTEGGMGITMPLLPWEVETLNKVFYFLMLITAVVTAITVLITVRSRYGYAFRAIRDGELGASAIGINTTLYKTFSLCLSALFVGITGGIYAYWITYIEPNNVFNAQISILMLVMVYLGGRGTILGPILGASVLELLSEIFWVKFLTIHTAILGIMIVVVVLFMPGGIMELVTRGRAGISWQWFKQNLTRYKV